MTIRISDLLEAASGAWLEEAAKFYDTATQPKSTRPLFHLRFAFKQSDFPKEKVVYIRDPNNRLVSKEEIEKLMGKIEYELRYEDDFEAFADGPGPHGGVWNYEVSLARAQANQKAEEKNWKGVKVSAVKGKTGAGWKIEFPMNEKDISKYVDQEAEKKAKDLAKKGIFPDDGYKKMASGSPIKGLAKSYYEKGKRMKKESVSARMNAILGMK